MVGLVVVEIAILVVDGGLVVVVAPKDPAVPEVVASVVAGIPVVVVRSRVNVNTENTLLT